MIEYDYTQQDWGYKPPTRPQRTNVPTVLELHHDVIPKSLGLTPVWHAQAIDRMHRAKGWSGVFYNVGVDSISGEKVELRGYGRVSTQDAWDALTVVVFGDLRTDVLSDAARKSIYDIYSLFWRIRGHRERPYKTECPAVNGMAFVDELRAGWVPPSDRPQFVVEDEAMCLMRVRWVGGSPTAENWFLYVGGTAHHLASNAVIEFYRDAAGWPVRELQDTTFQELVRAGSVYVGQALY